MPRRPGQSLYLSIQKQKQLHKFPRAYSAAKAGLSSVDQVAAAKTSSLGQRHMLPVGHRAREGAASNL